MAAKKRRSKRGSAANSISARLLSEVTFFLDKGLGRYIVRNALRDAGAIVEIHEDHFPADCPDTEWIKAVGKRGWVILSKDEHIRTNQLEVIELLQADTQVFILGGSQLTGSEMAQAFVAALPDMLRFINKFVTPFVASISRTGTVRMLLTHDELIKRIR